MKKTTLFLILVAIFAACGQSNKKAETIEIDPETVNVFYFHGKQRCKTCVAVGDVAKKTVETAFEENEKVIFYEINISEKANEDLCEKYEVAWNALIIAKGEDFVEITDQAFATAVENPQALENLIKEEVNKRLTD
ncbi:MAG: nitrophenyl compound nitroreductase subunit ArsF family protein [Bacteroidetes bacterium]|nr:nitrophenyl compound nitroreductase subunit ArsF family protein [Bacteroidota bacterium]